jgi:hypothetical protein
MMQCPKCSFEQADQNAECVRCGVIFEKYRKLHSATSQPLNLATENQTTAAETGEWIKNLLFYVRPVTHPLVFVGRLLFFSVIFLWGLKFILTAMETNYAMDSFWHLVNLPFHEAGHLFFRPLGRFMASLGGSLGQLLMPLVCLAVFLLKTRDTFAAAFALWWFGENFMDLAPYINDARALILPLVGGNTGRTSPYGFHDWEFILKESQLIRYDHVLANISYKLGTALMICALVWGGYILYKQYKIMKS